MRVMKGARVGFLALLAAELIGNPTWATADEYTANRTESHKTKDQAITKEFMGQYTVRPGDFDLSNEHRVYRKHRIVVKPATKKPEAKPAAKTGIPLTVKADDRTT